MIETERLVLRPFSSDDFDLIYRIYSDEEVLRYTPFDPMNREQAAEHLQRVMQDWNQDPYLSCEFAVDLKENGHGIGRAHILIDQETDTGMVGTLLLKKYWEKRFATEIFEALIRHCFLELHLHRVNAVCSPENTASWKAMERCGMRREALLVQKCRYVKNGVISWHDELEYAILASEYEARVGMLRGK